MLLTSPSWRKSGWGSSCGPPSKPSQSHRFRSHTWNWKWPSTRTHSHHTVVVPPTLAWPPSSSSNWGNSTTVAIATIVTGMGVPFLWLQMVICKSCSLSKSYWSFVVEALVVVVCSVRCSNLTNVLVASSLDWWGFVHCWTRWSSSLSGWQN